MSSARSRPVLGVFELEANSSKFHSSCCSGASKTHEGPRRTTARRRRLRDAFFEDDDSPEPVEMPCDFTREQIGRYGLIAVGGYGCWEEPLDSAEMYDPATDAWTNIPNLPGELGTICSGVVCGTMFYVFSKSEKLAGFDVEGGFWIVVQTSRLPPHLHDYSPNLVSCRRRLFLLSVSWSERAGQTNTREKAVRKLWELDLELTTWNEVVAHPDAPMDCNAAFVADENCIYGFEMFGIFGQVLDFVTGCSVSDNNFKWSRVSKKHAAHEADAASCGTKSAVILHL